MAIGTRLRKLREERGMAQGDIETATGLLRCYVSRVENGHTVPSVETLEKFAAAFNVPLYRLFYEGEEPPPLSTVTPSEDLEEVAKKPGQEGSEARLLIRLKRLLAKVDERDRAAFLALARKLAATTK